MCADCRLEAQYAHQQDVDIIPLMMEKGYKPTGWLGLIIGTRLYFDFHSAAVETDAAFMQQIDLVVRDLGERGKPKARSASRMSEGAPPGVLSRSLEPAPALAPAPAPALAPAPARAPAPPASALAIDHSGFTPSMQLAEPASVLQQRGVVDASVVAVVLEQQRLM